MAKKYDRSLKIQGYHRENKQVPELRLIGLWMEQLGFKVGDQVSITTRDRLLIIEPSEPEQDYKASLPFPLVMRQETSAGKKIGTFSHHFHHQRHS